MQTSDLNVNNTESDHANAIFRQFQDAIFSREHTYVKTLTKIIFDLLQWQEIATLSLPETAAIAPFISTTFPGHFSLGANDITRNISRVIFSRACADIFRWWIVSIVFMRFHVDVRSRFKYASCGRVLFLKVEKQNFFKNIPDTCGQGPIFVMILFFSFYFK